MNKRIGKQKAKETLPKLLDMVNKGLGPIEIIDQKKDEAVAYLISPEDYKKKSRKKSYAGFLKGKLIVSPDFDEPDWELIRLIEKSE
ncbi:MAG: hypothetical protein A3I68_02300 [Candidatus Melainabacteria bacterium RIFCSPLOWO2_02_FULL_35_15]|nr:MAG: hypothetical protein A3F80_08850 [Candidatus Melainabacteria bacterium RIFCSPLOWO2_12_FULL_35_11]OGI13238.1 MAG: hypothetical protein A3I68_02300 [Candidatus Melainabacteria bacterium RIFCSPLOWO2_02_FULL_35_15]